MTVTQGDRVRAILPTMAVRAENKGSMYAMATHRSADKRPYSGGNNGGALHCNSPLQSQELSAWHQPGTLEEAIELMEEYALWRTASI